jgi:hypothetical protein
MGFSAGGYDDTTQPSQRFARSAGADAPFNPVNRYDPNSSANPINQYNPNNPFNPVNRYNPDNSLNPVNKVSHCAHGPITRLLQHVPPMLSFPGS